MRIPKIARNKRVSFVILLKLLFRKRINEAIRKPRRGARAAKKIPHAINNKHATENKAFSLFETFLKRMKKIQHRAEKKNHRA